MEKTSISDRDDDGGSAKDDDDGGDQPNTSSSESDHSDVDKKATPPGKVEVKDVNDDAQEKKKLKEVSAVTSINNTTTELQASPAAAAAASLPQQEEAEEEEQEPDDDFYNSTSSALTEERWEEMFKRLLEFKEIHGHCLVPNRYKEDLQLGAWVTGQRKHYKLIQAGSGKSTPLTQERLDRLVDTGFEWTAKNPRHLMWEVRFSELKDFRRTYGHAQVPIGWEQNVQLANWVSTQRQEYKNLIKGKTSRLNDQRVNLLNSVGFAWELQRGGRRRRLTVASPSTRGGSEPRPPHPADSEEDGMDSPDSKKLKVEDTQDSIPVDDGSTPARTSATGRRRTTLKKKVVATPEGTSRCILPGVAILGGGRDPPSVPRPSPSRRSGRGGSSSAGTPARDRGSPGSGGMMEAHRQQQAAYAASARGNNEALLRALGGGNPHAATHNPWQMMPSGGYQFANPFAANQFMMGAAGNPFFPMAANPFAMNAFAASGGGAHFGMDPRHYGGGNPEAESMRGGHDQQRPFAVSSMNPAEQMDEIDGQQHFGGMGGGGGQQYDGFPFQQGLQGMGGQQQGGAFFFGVNDNSAAAAAAAQHLQAAAALTAGLDERSLPAHLAPLANVARRMNPHSGGASPAVGGGRDFNGGVGGNPMNLSSNGMARGRRGDPPADPPSDGQYNNMQGPHGERYMAGNVQARMRKDIFDDADED